MKIYSLVGQFLIVILLSTTLLKAQKPVIYDSPQYEFSTAMELFQKEKFGSSQQYFKYVYENTNDKQQDLKSNSYFYIGVCAVNLNNPDAGFFLNDFIRKYPVHAFVPEAYFYLGKFYFNKKQYKKVIENFDQIDERHLKIEDVAEYKFKKGYSYFMTNRFDEAKALMNSARNDQGAYRNKAIYYLAHIAYQEEQYEAALEDFLLLKDVPEYKDVIPNYLAQIYFIRGEYEKLIAIAPEVMKQDPQSELLRVVALSYYYLGMFPQAKEAFDILLTDDKMILDKNENFAVGYTNYQVENYPDAVKYLSLTVKNSEMDTLGQNSLYIIGDCFVKMNKLQMASQNFYEASKYDFLPEVKEDALYNYAKLQYETSSSPFNSAIKALEQYINTYPNSARSEEANSYLSKIYLSTKNYQGAINSLEKIQSKSPELLRAYQRCTHFRALEMINNRKYNDALAMLKKSITYPMDKSINIQNLFWKAECEYRTDAYKNAFYSFQAYHQTANAKNDANYVISYYSYGYSAIKLNKYSDAQQAFKTFLNFPKEDEQFDVEADATARLADCYYMQKNLKTAISYYEKCERLNRDNADYAIYQLAVCNGIMKNYSKKEELLNRLLTQYPKSNYNDDAEYELALTYHAQSEYSLAINEYKTFIRKFPKSPYIRQAHNRLALCYITIQENELAISTFKYVFENYPGSQEAKDALTNLENIYTELGNTTDFFDYVKNKNMNISVERQDSISYKAAENKYVRGDCETAVKSFSDYLRQYPNGLFAAKAYFYKAECEYGSNNFEAALADYQQLLKSYNTENNEVATRKVATILYNKKSYDSALTYFVKLSEIASSQSNIILANNGIMRCAYELGRYSEALSAASNIISINQNDQSLLEESLLIAGNSAMKLGDLTSAKAYFEKLSTLGTNDICAEAAYRLAFIEYQLKNYEKCEEIISNILAANYNSEYWYASTFILYGDYYVAVGNYFQARHTYQSIVDNYVGDDLNQIARQKLQELDQLENPQTNEPDEE